MSQLGRPDLVNHNGHKLYLCTDDLPRTNPKRSSFRFSTLQRMSVEELALKTQTHKEAWGLGKIDRWDLSQDTGELVFSLHDG
jgi:hypothetical protein